MDPEDVKEFGWAMAGEDVLCVELEAEHARIAARVAVDPTTVLGDFELSESDRAQLAPHISCRSSASPPPPPTSRKG
jgi:hypothetical protein